VEPGEYVALTGRSGAGKTTLLSLIGGLEPVQAGVVEVDGQRLDRLSGGALAGYRRNSVGFVFQHFGLLDSLNVLENVEMALAVTGAGPGERRPRAWEALERVGLTPRARHLPSQLSGGEAQRVAIARAVVRRPRLLLADEPTGNLDEATAASVLDVLEDLRRDFNATLVVVTHDVEVATRADRVISMRRGRVEHGA
jgi:putative ABC transport system ATP-binding protein